MASFKLPTIAECEQFGPSPVANNKLAFVPYSPLALLPSQASTPYYQQQQQNERRGNDFKLGKIADWTLAPTTHVAKPIAKKEEAATTAQEQIEEEETEEFSVVIRAKPSTKTQQQGGQQKNKWRGQQGTRGGKKPGQQRRFGGSTSYYRPTYQQALKPSIIAKPSWKVVSTYNLNDWNKVMIDKAPVGKDIAGHNYGAVEYYENKYDTITTKQPKSLQRFDHRVFFAVNPKDDKVLNELLAKEEEPELETGARMPVTVFTTDNLLAALMTAPRSVHPFDLVLEKKGHTLIMDKRPSSELDLMTVDENSTRDAPPFDEDRNNINSAQSLREEATVVNLNFSQEVLQRGKARRQFEHPNPFRGEHKEETLSSVAYKYRRWDLSEHISVVCRCQIDGMEKTATEEIPILVRALNEYLPRTGSEWKQKLDLQRGNIFVQEVKNNLNKMSRWAVQAVLADAKQIRLGFIARAAPNSNALHTLLGVEKYAPQDFAKQLELNSKNIWGITKSVFDSVSKHPDGTYVLVRDSVKQNMYLYAVPANEALEEEEEEEQVDDGDFDAQNDFDDA